MSATEHQGDAAAQLTQLLAQQGNDVDALLKTVFTFVDRETEYFRSVADPRVPVIKALQAAGVKKRSLQATAKPTTKPQPSVRHPSPN